MLRKDGKETAVKRDHSLAALSIAAIGLASCLMGCSNQVQAAPPMDKCSRSATPAPAGGDTRRFGSLTLRIPAGWYAVHVCFQSAGFENPLGYITTARPIAQCQAKGSPFAVGTGGGCGPPSGRLGRNDVLVTIDSGGGGHRGYDTFIAGRPAYVSSDRPTSAFGSDHYRLEVNIKGTCVGTVPDYIPIYAEVPKAKNEGRRAVLNMLNTATYTPRRGKGLRHCH